MSGRKPLLPQPSSSGKSNQSDVPELSLATDLRRNLVQEMDDAKTCSEKIVERFPSLKFTKLKVGALLLQTPGLLADGLMMRYGIDEMQRPILGFIARSETDKNSIQTMHFLSASSANLEQVQDSIVKTLRIIRERKLPDEWDRLERRGEIGAAITALVFSSYATIAAVSAQRRYFKDYEYSDLVANGVAFTYTFYYLFTSGRSSWETIRENILRWFYKKTPKSEHHLISRLIGWFLALFNALGSSLQGYMGITVGFQVTSTGVQYFLLSLSFMAGYCDVSYSIELNQSALDDLYERLEECEIENHEFAAMAISSFLGAIFIDALADSYFETFLTAVFPFTMPYVLCRVLGYSIAISDGIPLTWGATSIASEYVTKPISDALSGMKSYLCSKEKKDTEKKDEYIQMEAQRPLDQKDGPPGGLALAPLPKTHSTMFAMRSSEAPTKDVVLDVLEVKRRESEERIENTDTKEPLIPNEEQTHIPWYSGCVLM